jgi:hypothetical protein
VIPERREEERDHQRSERKVDPTGSHDRRRREGEREKKKMHPASLRALTPVDQEEALDKQLAEEEAEAVEMNFKIPSVLCMVLEYHFVVK